MKHIENYHNIRQGESIFLLGNGPSLNQYPIADLDPSKCFTMNRSWKAIPGASWHLCAGDLTGVRKEPETIFFVGGHAQSVGPDVLARYNCPVVLVQTKVGGNKFRACKSQFEAPPSLDLRLGWEISHAGLAAMQIAWWMGYKRLFLLGFDGEGGHYTKMDKNLIPDHKKHKAEMFDFMVELRRHSVTEVYNLNPENCYKHTPIEWDRALWLSEIP